MTAVDGPGPADVMYEAVCAAFATVIRAIPADLRAEMLTRSFRDLGTELRDHGHLPTGDTTVEWGVERSDSHIVPVLSESETRRLAAIGSGRGIRARTVTPWVPVQSPTDESETPA